jgi:GTP-binding protein Era
MGDSDLPPGYRSGFVVTFGRPSVGKSTLINAILGQLVVSVSPRPQTTRRRQLGILTLPQAQIVFVDCPGIHHPRTKLGEHLNTLARDTLQDADVILALFDLSQPPKPEDRLTATAIEALPSPPPVLAVLNKVDAVPASQLGERVALFFDLLPRSEPFLLSATRGDGRQALLDRILGLLPLGPRYYPEEEITDTNEREIAADLIRSAALHLLRDEVPHGIAVRVDEYTERGEHGAFIAATLFVERESHKGIVIGKGGTMLRQIGSQARREIEVMSGRKVYLETRVKVFQGWRDDEQALRQLGYDA